MSAVRERLGHLDVLVLTAGLWFLAKLLRYAFPPLFETFQATFRVSNTALGLAFTGFMLCYAAMQFPSGLLGDRIGTVRVMVAGAFVAALAAIGLVVEASFGLLVVAMLVIGAGTGLHKTVSVPLLANAYPAHPGRVFGVHETVGTAAGVVAPIAAIAFLGWPGWRSLFVLAGVVGLVVATLAVVRIPARLEGRPGTQVRDRSSPPVRRYLGLFRRRRFTLFVLITMLFAFAYGGVIAFLPLYLVAVGDVSIGIAGALYSLLFAVSVVQLATGELSDRMGRRRVLGACVAGAGLGLVLLLVLSGPLLLALAVIVFGLGGHGYRPVRDAYLTAIVPEDAMGGGIGMVRTLLMGASAAAPAVVGVVADAVGFRAAFGILGLSLLLATVLVAVLAALPQSPRVATARPAG